MLADQHSSVLFPFCSLSLSFSLCFFLCPLFSEGCLQLKQRELILSSFLPPFFLPLSGIAYLPQPKSILYLHVHWIKYNTHTTTVSQWGSAFHKPASSCSFILVPLFSDCCAPFLNPLLLAHRSWSALIILFSLHASSPSLPPPSRCRERGCNAERWKC